MARKKKAQAEEVTCPECSHTSPADSDTCSQCGASFNKATDELTEEPAEREAGERNLDELMSVPGMKKAKAEILHDAGFRSVSDIQNAEVVQLASLKGIGENFAQKMIRNARGLAIPQEDKSLANWLAGEDGGLPAWLSGEGVPAEPQAEATAEPEVKPDASLVRWLTGEEESIDTWLRDTTEMARPELPVPKKDLRRREA
jgi:hypothetical protein